MRTQQEWAAAVQASVVDVLAANSDLAAADIDPDLPISTLPGVDSIQLLRAVADLEEACGLPIPDDVLFAAKTPRELASLVAELPGGHR